MSPCMLSPLFSGQGEGEEKSDCTAQIFYCLGLESWGFFLLSFLIPTTFVKIIWLPVVSK